MYNVYFTMKFEKQISNIENFCCVQTQSIHENVTYSNKHNNEIIMVYRPMFTVKR